MGTQDPEEGGVVILFYNIFYNNWNFKVLTLGEVAPHSVEMEFVRGDKIIAPVSDHLRICHFGIYERYFADCWFEYG